MPFIIKFNDITSADKKLVGGKNAYLGDMIRHLESLVVKVPDGFALTTEAYQQYLDINKIRNEISNILNALNIEDLDALAKASREIQHRILQAYMPDEIQSELKPAFDQLKQGKYQVAVRSSATAEDMPEASFAGQQETILNINTFEGLIESIKAVYASLFTERAISYRYHQQLSHEHVYMSVGIQRMIRSDLASSGVMFTLDTESGFDQVVLISSTYGLGEIIVQGKVSPDEFYVHKPTFSKGYHSIISKSLGNKNKKMVYAEDQGIKTIDVSEEDSQKFSISDNEIIQLTQYAMAIENHYQLAMDIEWAKDGIDGELYIVQARPETVKSHQDKNVIEKYILKQKSEVLVTGKSVGTRIASGIARYISNPSDKHLIQQGDILVTESTGPDWEPIMQKAGGIVTDHGGRTCHAAIVARELGVPAVVGCHKATTILKTGDEVTISCAEGETGFVYKGNLDYEINKIKLNQIPKLPVKICMNVSNPYQVFNHQFIPNDGVGLARIEFIIANMIGIHPKAILGFNDLTKNMQNKILEKSQAYVSPKAFYIEKLAEGIATIAAAFFPKPVIVRFSDFKSNEYINLLGGELFEPKEENPMLGYRGAHRYITDNFKDCFALECEAILRVRNIFGLKNTKVMIPFVRTLDEAQKITASLKLNGITENEDSPEVYMMCELPSNVILAEEFLKYFSGFSIGSNDLTQLTLGVDRDSELVANIFNEQDPALKNLLHQVISTCRKMNKYIGICGQGPSDHPDFAKWLLNEGIEAISLNPDSVLKTMLVMAEGQK